MCSSGSQDGRVRCVLDEVGLIRAGSVDRGSGSGLLVAAVRKVVGKAGICGQRGHGELGKWARCQCHSFIYSCVAAFDDEGAGN